MQPPLWFQQILKEDHPLRFRNGVWMDETIASQSGQWSFSQEWKEHADARQENTWVWNVQERLDQFFIETKTSEEQIKDKIILDAGCGNGQLTEAIANSGARLVGIDIHACLPASKENLQFVQASFDDPPFKENSFDIIIANGSIHHSPGTKKSFRSLASLVNENGKLYVWVYRKPESMAGKILLGIVDGIRFFIARLPVSLQKFSVRLITEFTYWLSRIREGENTKRSRKEMLINNYDTFTPRYRHYHTTTELAQWFHECGFEEPVLSHWDNKYGFGMMAVKNKDRLPAAGLNFGKNQ
jgi:SAM-dependent methyltransferase